MSTAPIISINDVTASYGKGRRRFAALRNVSLTIEKGEIFGLLGPNGAGKTTLLSCIEALHQPAQGQIEIDGLIPTAAKGRLGIQLQKGALLDNLTVSEIVTLYAALYNVFLSRQQLEALLARFGLNDQQSKLIRHLSGGQQQRVALAVAIANNPAVVLLDEPTSALDPHARRAVWELVRQLHDEKRTIVLTTHSMDEAEALCGRVANIDSGRIIAVGSPASIIKGLDLHATLKAAVDLPVEQIQGLHGVKSSRYSGQYIEIQSEAPQVTMSELNRLALQAGRTISEITIRQPNLEDAFLKLTGRAYAA